MKTFEFTLAVKRRVSVRKADSLVRKLTLMFSQPNFQKNTRTKVILSLISNERALFWWCNFAQEIGCGQNAERLSNEEDMCTRMFSVNKTNASDF